MRRGAHLIRAALPGLAALAAGCTLVTYRQPCQESAECSPGERCDEQGFCAALDQVTDRGAVDAGHGADAQSADVPPANDRGPDGSPLDGAGRELAGEDAVSHDATPSDLQVADSHTADLGGADQERGDLWPLTEDAAVDDAGTYPTLTWVHIPGGSFEMGCSIGDLECLATELPRHAVTVTAFHMQATEITQAQYLAVMGENPSYFSEAGTGTACGLDCPVEQINWHQAKAFCEAIGGRLPSEAEWEYAARAGATTRYACGDDAACLSSIAWYSANSYGTTHPVGTKAANAFGLYDVHGNVWEWVEDCWHADYVGAPSTGEVWAGGQCLYRPRRGGSWANSTDLRRVSHRFRSEANGAPNNAGARCARSP